MYRGDEHAYLLLRLDVVLHGSANAPRSVSPQLGLLALQLRNQGYPEVQGLQVVRVVEVLNELFEVVECSNPVFQIALLPLDDLHVVLHHLRIRFHVAAAK